MAKAKVKSAPPSVRQGDLPAEKAEFPQRLCSEIQLFDLCERTDCAFKRGRYCTDPAMLARFEAISDEEDENAMEQYLVDDMDEMDGDDLEYDEGIGVDEEEPEDEDY
jgi:hypothetical protein